MSLSVIASAQRPHDGDVISICSSGGRVFSGGEDGLVKVWDEKLNQTGEIRVSTYSVYDMAYKGENLYTCTYDGKITIWNPPKPNEKEWTTQAILEGHLESIRRIRFKDDDTLYSGDESGVIIEWIKNEKGRVFNLLEEIWDLWVAEDTLYTVRDKDVVITNIKGKNTFTSKGTFEGRGPMHLMDGKLYCLTRDGLNITAYAINGDKFQNIGSLKGHERIINTLAGRDNMLFSGGWDGLIKSWDVRTLQQIASYDAKDCINCLSLNENMTLYAGGSNGIFVGLKTR